MRLVLSHSDPKHPGVFNQARKTLMSKVFKKKKKVVLLARTSASGSHLHNDNITLCCARLHQHHSAGGSETKTFGCYNCTVSHTAKAARGVTENMEFFKQGLGKGEEEGQCYTWDSPYPGTKSLACQRAS